VSEHDHAALAHYGLLRHRKKRINGAIIEVYALCKYVMIPTLNILTSCTSHKPLTYEAHGLETQQNLTVFVGPMGQNCSTEQDMDRKKSYLIRNLCVEKSITNFIHFFATPEVHLSHFPILTAWCSVFPTVTPKIQ